MIPVGILGFAGSGKDTFARMLREELMAFDITSITASLADAGKQMLLQDDFKIPFDDLYGPSENRSRTIKNTDVTVRHALQKLLHDWGRLSIGENVWIDALFSKYAYLPKDVVLIITDVRYFQEAQVIYDKGGFIAHVDRVGRSRPYYLRWADSCPFLHKIYDLLGCGIHASEREVLQSRTHALVTWTVKNYYDTTDPKGVKLREAAKEVAYRLSLESNHCFNPKWERPSLEAQFADVKENVARRMSTGFIKNNFGTTDLTEHFAKATKAAVADLHAKGVSAHAEVDGVWQEIPPRKDVCIEGEECAPYDYQKHIEWQTERDAGKWIEKCSCGHEHDNLGCTFETCNCEA